MTDADRLANFNGWMFVKFVNQLGILRSSGWTHTDGRMSLEHPMSTLDAVAASLPEGWEWRQLYFLSGKSCMASAHDPKHPRQWSKFACVDKLGDDEKDARTSAALAAWEVRDGK